MWRKSSQKKAIDCGGANYDGDVVVIMMASYKKGLKVAFSALHPKADCTLTPNEFLLSSPEAPRTTQARQTSASEGRNKLLPRNFACKSGI